MTKLLFLRNLDGTRQIRWTGRNPWTLTFTR